MWCKFFLESDGSSERISQKQSVSHINGQLEAACKPKARATREADDTVDLLLETHRQATQEGLRHKRNQIPSTQNKRGQHKSARSNMSIKICRSEFNCFSDSSQISHDEIGTRAGADHPRTPRNDTQQTIREFSCDFVDNFSHAQCSSVPLA